MVRSSLQPRRGITRIQVLVLIAILLVLIGLFLTGVQTVRQAAARTQTMCNLKQLGVAINNYLGANKNKAPHSVGYNPNSEEASLFYNLLPYLEGSAIQVERATHPVKVLEAPLDFTNPGGQGLTSYASNASLFGLGAPGDAGTDMMVVFNTKGSTNVIIFVERFAAFNGTYDNTAEQASNGNFVFGAVPGSQIQFGTTGGGGRNPATNSTGWPGSPPTFGLGIVLPADIAPRNPAYVQAFSNSGCCVSMGDGSVRSVNSNGNNATTNFVWACDPIATGQPTSDW